MKIIKKKLSEIKFDENQPRQDINEEDIIKLVNSIEQNTLIEPIVIDEEGGLISGELRAKALMKLGVKEIECKVIEGLEDWVEKGLRQWAENEHRTNLSSEDRENFISKLWKSGKFKTQRELAKRLNIVESAVSNILRAKEVRDELPPKIKALRRKVSTDVLKTVAILPKPQREQIIEMVIEDEITPTQVARVVQSRKKLIEREIQPEVFRYESDLKSNLQELEIVKRRLGLIYSAVKKKYEDLFERPDDTLLGFLETKYEDIAHNQYDQITEAEGSTVRNLEELKYMAKRVVDEDLGKCPFCLNEINLDRNLTQQVIYEHELKNFGEGKEKLAREKYQLEEWIEKIDDYERKVVYFEWKIKELKNKIEVLKRL